MQFTDLISIKIPMVFFTEKNLYGITKFLKLYYKTTVINQHGTSIKTETKPVEQKRKSRSKPIY